MPPTDAPSHEEAFQAIEMVLKTVTYREREIFKLRTGFGDGYVYTWDEIARIFNVNRHTIREIGARVFRKMQHPVRQRVLEKYFATLYQDPPAEQHQIEVADVVERVKELTPSLLAHLQKREGDLPKIPWEVFEHLVAEFLASWGFSDVRLVGRNCYTAADVFAVTQHDPIGVRFRWFVEMKRRREKVGIEVIDRVLGAIQRERTEWGWDVGMIVSLAGFADFRGNTFKKIEYQGIRLKDGEDVIKWLRDYRPSDKGLWLPSALHYRGAKAPDEPSV